MGVSGDINRNRECDTGEKYRRQVKSYKSNQREYKKKKYRDERDSETDHEGGSLRTLREYWTMYGVDRLIVGGYVSVYDTIGVSWYC